MDLLCLIQSPRGANVGGLYTDKSPTLTANSWEQNNLIMRKTDKSCESVTSDFSIGTYRTFKVDGGFRPMADNGKSPTLAARARTDGSGQPCVLMGGARIRRLTPKECARLQTVPDWYQFPVSETQQYKMLGNGWTIEVIKHIFKFLNISD